MKRIGNLFNQICDLDNLELAEKSARRGKSKQYGVRLFDRDRDMNLLRLNEVLLSGSYKTSEYSTFKIYEPKERIISSLPYFPDRITHHAIISVLEPIFVSYFTADTYSCIKGRGVHKMARKIKKALRDEADTQYCLKIDIVKFYPSVDHTILKQLLRRKFKDYRLLALLDEMIDSSPGVPIGNYTSQFFGNFYLTGLDHWLKERMKVKYLFRYCDDIIILAPTKEELHDLLIEIKAYLWDNLRLKVKDNHQVFLVDKRGIDTIGYVFHRRYTRMRKSIKQRFCRMMAKKPDLQSIGAYYGWAVHANTKNLLNKLFNENIFGNLTNTIPKAISRRTGGRKNKNRTRG